ncbi:MAG: PIG-L deacetylase family protein [Candidatus Bathyarchaeia archaeon]|jgi:LmbE family N-acetylglucosaminyl deacetylase
MLKLNLFGQNKEPKILCLGAHCDDIEIGCGGTLTRIIQETPGAQVYWAVFSGNEERRLEAKKSAQVFLEKVFAKTIDIQNFKESYFPFVGDQIKDYFEQISNNFSPDLIFTHHSEDAHQDHRLISSLTWNTFRNHLVLEYEIPKYDGDLGVPNVYFTLSKNDVELKVTRLLEHFKSQSSRQWFDPETFKAIMRIRGIEINSSSKYAEAFYSRKILC